MLLLIIHNQKNLDNQQIKVLYGLSTLTQIKQLYSMSTQRTAKRKSTATSFDKSVLMVFWMH